MIGVNAFCNPITVYSNLEDRYDQLCSCMDGKMLLSNKSCAHASIHGCPFLIDSNSRLCAWCAMAVANGNPCSHKIYRPELYLGVGGLENHAIRTFFFSDAAKEAIYNAYLVPYHLAL
jgi:hypothetical protein